MAPSASNVAGVLACQAAIARAISSMSNTALCNSVICSSDAAVE